jgi:mannose-6-phosphate isomerase-like protein (cupin superfamily)
MTLSIQEMEKRIVRYGDLQPCKTAFIDAHTPGSDQKENFTIIGCGVSESPDQHVHISETPGFNIGAAGQPPKCCNSLHTHRTAEVFFVLSGRWRFFWGQHGDAGEVVLEPGDLIDIPTQVFRGFENIGTDYGMIMAVLGGDDAGGGVLWAPHVIEAAKAHGLILAENGQLYDTKKGQVLPDGLQSMPLLTDEQLLELPELPASAVVPRFIARNLDMRARADAKPTKVLSGDPEALIIDKPGFTIDFVTEKTISTVDAQLQGRHQILMISQGHWKVTWQHDGETVQVVLAVGDTCAIPPELVYQIKPAMTGEAGLFRVCNTDDPAGPTLL